MTWTQTITDAELQKHVDRIEAVVSRKLGVIVADMHGNSKMDTVVLARGIAMYLVRSMTRASYPQIGRAMGGKDHTTVLLACRRVQERINTDSTWAAMWVEPAMRELTEVPAQP